MHCTLTEPVHCSFRIDVSETRFIQIESPNHSEPNCVWSIWIHMVIYYSFYIYIYIYYIYYIYIVYISIYIILYIYTHTLYIYISCLSNKLKLLKALLSKHSQAVQPGDSSKVSPNCCSACFAATRMESWAPQTRLGGKDRRSHKGERLVNDW